MGVELTLAVQIWRFGLFDLAGIINTNNTFFKLSQAQQYQYSQLYAYTFGPIGFVQSTNPLLQQQCPAPAPSMAMDATVFFQGSVLVNGGSYSGTFALNTAGPAVVVGATAYDSNGAVGFNISAAAILPPLTTSLSVPPFMVVGDSLTIPILVTNMAQTVMPVIVYQVT